MTVKLKLKRSASSLLSSSGLHSLAERVYITEKSFVLMYHRVVRTANKKQYYVQPGMFVTPESLEKHIIFLKNRFKIIFLEELVENILKGEDIGGLCAITFDDGWRDNYTNAFPLLEKYQIPSTVFLATGYVGTNRMFWPEELCTLLARGFDDCSVFEGAPQSFDHFKEEVGVHSPNRDDTVYERAIECLKKFSPWEREEVLGYLRSKFHTNSIPRQMLSWNEVREMYSSGLVRFGAHTVGHEILDQIPFEMAREEIFQSREEIENRLGCRVRTFAYPNGNYNKSISASLADFGFTAAVTTRKGFLAQKIPLMKIPRISIHEDVGSTIPMFRSRILFPKF